MNLGAPPESAFCSRAGQKRAHSQISSGSRNGAASPSEADSRSSSSAWHMPVLPTFNPNLTSIPFIATRHTDIDFFRNTQQAGVASAVEEGSSSGRGMRGAQTETEREETSRFLRLQLPPPLPQVRFAGDGFDYRRPVSSMGPPDRVNGPINDIQMNSNSATAIDLTGSDSEDETDSGAPNNAAVGANHSLPLQIPSVHAPRTSLADYFLHRREQALTGQRAATSRPPRFGRDVLNTDVEVIDLDAEENAAISSRPPGEASRTQGRSSPEVEFLSSRPLSPARRRVPPVPAGLFHLADDDINIPGGDFVEANLDQLLEDVRFISEHAIRPQVRRGPGMNRGIIAHIRQARVRRGGMQPRGFVVPDLDFVPAGFNMGIDMEEPEPATYEAPPPAPEGFTMTPQEDDTLICPNCERELCTGSTELDQQVWVLKGCGHVYCGTCAANRATSANKRRERGIPAINASFKVCKVEGCDKKCTGQKSMFQLFL